MQPPTTSYPHGYSNNRHGSSTSVKSHFLLPIPGCAVKTYHCTRHTEHYSTTDHRRGRIRRVSYPEIPGTRPYPFTVDPSSTRPQPTAGQTRKQGLHATGSGVFLPSHPLRHHGVRGWPAILGARRYSGLHSARQNFTSKAPPASLPPLDPIKGQAGDSTKGEATTDKQKASHHPTVEDQHPKQSPLYSHFFSLRPGIGSLSHSL
jgi:hypothetical protein